MARTLTAQLFSLLPTESVTRITSGLEGTLRHETTVPKFQPEGYWTLQPRTVRCSSANFDSAGDCSMMVGHDEPALFLQADSAAAGFSADTLTRGASLLRDSLGRAMRKKRGSAIGPQNPDCAPNRASAATPLHHLQIQAATRASFATATPSR